MIRTQTCQILVCDGCGLAFEPSGDYVEHYDDAETARDVATDGHDWWTDGAVDLCDRCAEKPHPVVPSADPYDEQFCLRCKHSLDSPVHDPNAPVVPVKATAQT